MSPGLLRLTAQALHAMLLVGDDLSCERQARVEAELDERLGYEVAVLLRSAKEVTAIAAREPFEAKAIEAAAASKGKPQVVLLGKKPTAKARKARTAESSRAAETLPSPSARRTVRKARRSAALSPASAASSISWPR